MSIGNLNIDLAALKRSQYNDLKSLFQNYKDELLAQENLLKNIEKAFEAYEKGNSLEPIAGCLDESLRYFLEATVLAPSFFLAWVRAGGIQLRKKEYENALKSYKKAEQLNSEDPRPKLGIAYVYFITGRLEEGESLFREVNEKNPNLDEPHVGLGWLFNDHGLEEKAREQFSMALAKNPKNDGAHEGMGFAYLFKNQKAEAAKHFRLSIELNPNNGGSYVGLGLVEHQLKNLEEAEKNFLIALEISPYDESAWNGLGYIATDRGDLEKAEEYHLKARKYTPAQPFSYLALARLYKSKKKYNESMQMYEECLPLIYNGETRESIVKEMEYTKYKWKIFRGLI